MKNRHAANRPEEAGPLKVRGKLFERGVGTVAESILVVALDGGAKTFSAQVGLDDAKRGSQRSSVEFFVIGDGRMLWRSGVMRTGSEAKPFEVNIVGVRNLLLKVGDAEDGDLVAVALHRKNKLGLVEGRVTERMGSIKSEKAISLIAIHTHGIPNLFPATALAESEAAKPATLAGPGRREDWRHIPLVTIDPADAKDHDDAVHAAPDPDPKNIGGHIVTVAIADVSAYVHDGSAMDREARLRGNSVYFPDRVVPMLPERISNNLCSLRPDEDRAALAVRMIIGSDGRKKSHSFCQKAFWRFLFLRASFFYVALAI
jgi:hypothetical protein